MKKSSQIGLQRLVVLGLEFDTRQRTVSMPTKKIEKARHRVIEMLSAQRTSKTKLQQLLGSLRHVCTCCRALRPFFQRVQALCSRTPPQAQVKIPSDVKEDLSWCLSVLEHGQLQNLPTNMFQQWPAAAVHLYMDASNQGLAVLDPARKRFIQVRFDAEEQALIDAATGLNAFTINVREQLSIAFATLLWGDEWRQWFAPSVGQVWCWVDNATAVASTNKLASQNGYAQELNRVIGFAEATMNFRVRCLHLPGSLNVMADAASRAWSAPFTDVWSSLSQDWKQDAVPTTLRKPYKPCSANYNSKAWLVALVSSTKQRGSSGQHGAQSTGFASGFRPNQRLTPTNSLSSPSTVGVETVLAMPPPPLCPRSAILLGIIASPEDTASDCTLDTWWRCEGCNGCRPHRVQKRPPPSPSSAPCEHHVTSRPRTTASCGGLRSWATSIFYEAANICKPVVPTPTSSSP